MAQELPRLFTLEEIKRVTSIDSFLDELITAIRQGFAQFDSFFAAPIQTLGAPPAPPFVSSGSDSYSAQTCVKSGYFPNQAYYVIKVAGGGQPWPANSGLLQLFSQKTGRLEALLLDEGMLTELRTAAIGALAVQLWAPRIVTKIGILGCGVQARYQLMLLSRVLPCRNLMVFGRSSSKVQVYVEEMTKLGWDVTIASFPNELLESCQVIVTTTSAREPLLTGLPCEGARTPAVKLIVCIGSDAPGKAEVATSILDAADLRVADDPEQSRERGEYQRLGPEQHVCSLRDGIVNSALHRQDENDNRLVIVDSSGVALQDCVIAQLVHDQLTSSK